MTETLNFGPLAAEDLGQMLEIQEEAFAEMKDVSLLRRNTPEMLAECLQVPHWTLGAWEGGRLAAFSVLYVSHEASEDLSLSLQDVEWRGGAANNKLCIVRPEYRGRGLQLRLGGMIEDEARKRGFALLCATASPLNTYSCRNLEAQGYRKNCCLEKYGFSRNLYYKTLSGGF